METLIVILIAVLIVQNCIYSYVNLRDYKTGRRIADLTQTLNNATDNFLIEKKKYEATISEQKMYITAFQVEIEQLKQELKDFQTNRCLKIEKLRHKWSLGDSTEAKYKLEAYDELIEMLKEE